MEVQYKVVHQDTILKYKAIKVKRLDNGLYLYFCVGLGDIPEARKTAIFSSKRNIFHPNTKYTPTFQEYYDVNCNDRLVEFL